MGLPPEKLCNIGFLWSLFFKSHLVISNYDVHQEYWRKNSYALSQIRRLHSTVAAKKKREASMKDSPRGDVCALRMRGLPSYRFCIIAVDSRMSGKGEQRRWCTATRFQRDYLHCRAVLRSSIGGHSSLGKYFLNTKSKDSLINFKFLWQVYKHCFSNNTKSILR